CPCCAATGQVKTAESMAIEVMRLLMTAANRQGVSRIAIEIHERVGNYLNNRKRKEITSLEDRANVSITVAVRTDVGPEHLDVRTFDEAGLELKNLLPAPSKSRR
ncbi:MAG TPA: ribonuclease E, partial [Planctomycetaceae bacterium]|nr:ribonuclease E [Planctomycetaceae bacterium]